MIISQEIRARDGRLVVSLSEPFERPPVIDGWQPWFLARLGRDHNPPQKIVYKPVIAAGEE